MRNNIKYIPFLSSEINHSRMTTRVYEPKLSDCEATCNYPSCLPRKPVLTCAPILVSFQLPEQNIMTNSNLKGKEFISSYREANAETQSENLEAGTKAEDTEECHIVVPSLTSVQLPFFYSPGLPA